MLLNFQGCKLVFSGISKGFLWKSKIPTVVFLNSPWFDQEIAYCLWCYVMLTGRKWTCAYDYLLNFLFILQVFSWDFSCMFMQRIIYARFPKWGHWETNQFYPPSSACNFFSQGWTWKIVHLSSSSWPNTGGLDSKAYFFGVKKHFQR